jgi:hypothetical protein
MRRRRHDFLPENRPPKKSMLAPRVNQSINHARIMRCGHESHTGDIISGSNYIVRQATAAGAPDMRLHLSISICIVPLWLFISERARCPADRPMRAMPDVHGAHVTGNQGKRRARHTRRNQINNASHVEDHSSIVYNWTSFWAWEF